MPGVSIISRLQKRLIRVGKLDELGRRNQVKRRLQNRLQADAEHGGDHRAADGIRQIHPYAAHVARSQRADADEDAKVHQTDDQTADHDHHAGRVFAQHADGGQPPSEQVSSTLSVCEVTSPVPFAVSSVIIKVSAMLAT